MGYKNSADGALRPADFRRQTTAAGEKRHEPRLARRKMLDVLPCSARERWHFESVELTDCSLSGIGFESMAPMQPGEQFLVKLLLRGRIRMLIYTVRYCREQPRRRYAIGAEFSGYIAAPFDDDPHELLAEILKDE